MSILLLLFGLVVGIFVVWKQARRHLFAERSAFDSLFIVLISMAVGARVLYCVTHIDQFGFSILRWLVIPYYPGFSSGGVLLGGVIGFWIVYERKRSIPFGILADSLTNALVAGLPFWLFAYGLLGMDNGKDTNWSIFAHHPISVYRILVLLLVMLGLVKLNRMLTRVAGLRSMLTWGLLSLAYILVDFARKTDVYYGKLSPDQWASGITGILLLGGFFLLFSNVFFSVKKRRGVR